MSATITYKVIDTTYDQSESSIALNVTFEIIAQEGDKRYTQTITTGLPTITKDDEKFTDISKLSKDELETKLINFAKNNWGYPENAVPELAAIEKYTKETCEALEE